MTVARILAIKGRDVVTAQPHLTLRGRPTFLAATASARLSCPTSRRRAGHSLGARHHCAPFLRSGGADALNDQVAHMTAEGHFDGGQILEDDDGTMTLNAASAICPSFATDGSPA